MKKKSLYNRSEIALRAWAECRKKGLRRWTSAAMSGAWGIEKTRKKMREGVVPFAYRKVSGAVRRALGTLKGLPQDGAPKGAGRGFNPSVCTYWDVEKLAWRSFRTDLFLGILPDDGESAADGLEDTPMAF